MKSEDPLRSAAIYLRGHDLDPEHISKLLGITPSRAQIRGGSAAGSTRFTAKIGLWSIKRQSDSRSVSDLIDELFEVINDCSFRLDEIQGVEDAELDISFAFAGDEVAETVEFKITKNQIERAGRLGLSICVTV